VEKSDDIQEIELDFLLFNYCSEDELRQLCSRVMLDDRGPRKELVERIMDWGEYYIEEILEELGEESLRKISLDLGNEKELDRRAMIDLILPHIVYYSLMEE
jgi:hypothetical protein